MSPLALQTLLRARGLVALRSLAIRAQSHVAFPNLWCFTFDPRYSPLSNAAVQEARGLILDEAHDWAVVSMGFCAFFDLDSPLAAKIDWADALVQEKLDGSLMALYGYAGAWQVQSISTADATDSVTHSTLTSRDLFWQTWQHLGAALPPPPHELGSPYTFVFELMTPETGVLVRHPHPRLALLGVRNLRTLAEEDPLPWTVQLKVEAVPTFQLGRLSRYTLRSCVRVFAPFEHEGFVACDARFRRVKIQNEAYVLMARLREGWSERRALDLIWTGDQHEYLKFFPESRAALQRIEARVRGVTDAVDNAYQRIQDEGDQKAFAAQASQSPYRHVLFALRQHPHLDAYTWLLRLSEPRRLHFLARAGEVFSSAAVTDPDSAMQT